jgi:hypothetical protein
MVSSTGGGALELLRYPQLAAWRIGKAWEAEQAREDGGAILDWELGMHESSSLPCVWLEIDKEEIR